MMSKTASGDQSGNASTGAVDNASFTAVKALSASSVHDKGVCLLTSNLPVDLRLCPAGPFSISVSGCTILA